MIILVRRIKPSSVVEQPLLRAGFVAAVALFGIAWMADTFISANEETIIEPLGAAHRGAAAAARGRAVHRLRSHDEPVGDDEHAHPDRARGGARAGVITAMWPSLIGVWLFPANGPQIAAVETDLTGSTKLTQVPVWHSFTIPMLVSWVAVVVAGLLIQLVVPV